MAVLTMAKLTFREASRRKILLAAVLLGIAFLIVYAYGFYVVRTEAIREMGGREPLMLSEMSNFILMAGLYAVNFLTVMMAVLTSVDTVSGEISSGTIHTLVSKPVSRWQILLGKWLGYVGLLTLYLTLMAGGVFLIVGWIAGYTPPNTLQGLFLMWLTALVLLSISFLGGTLFSTLANGVMVFGLYGIAFVGGWVEQIGAIFHNQTAVNIGVITSLVMPTEALWKRAAYEMQSAVAGMVGGMTPFSPTSVPSPMMVGYSIVYLVILLGLAVRKFNRRDL